MPMVIDLGVEYEEFRAETGEWIDGHAPDELAALANWGFAQMAGGGRGAALASAMREPAYQTWVERLGEDRYICAQWPEEFGGRGWDAIRFSIFNEELRRRGLPIVRRGMGETLAGPAIITHGTDAQRAHFLPRIVDGTDVYCQGYSEPNHGSDLGAVETRGIVDGDEIVITGQKIWTSGARNANMMFCLCRTDPDAPKHRGISYVLVPFTAENHITISPVRQLTGAAEFYEDFLDGARAPLFNVIGGLNNGWIPAMTTLGYERGGNATIAHLGYQRELDELIELAKENGAGRDPVVRQKLAWCYTQVQLMRYAGLRTLSSMVAGRQPGPEASVSKLFWSEYHKVFGEVALDVVGVSAMLRPDGEGYRTGIWQDIFLASRAGTIYSGTSQIQKNIIGERALGLPKEPPATGGRH
jgi:alkylation response protein AidB-like acyl-CoA dehydrogenase